MKKVGTSTKTKKEPSLVRVLRKLHPWPNSLTPLVVPISFDGWWLRTRGLAYAITTDCGYSTGMKAMMDSMIFVPNLVPHIRPLWFAQTSSTGVGSGICTTNRNTPVRDASARHVGASTSAGRSEHPAGLCGDSGSRHGA